MKSSFRILAACLAASLALVSCEKESTTKTDNGGETKEGVRTITMSFSTSTRSALGNDGVTPHFTDGDQIMLADKDGTSQTVTVSVSGNTATAFTTLTGELTAVYPASASDNGKNYTVSSSQDGTFAKANICTATIPDGANPSAVFETQVAILCFYVDNSIGVSKIEIDGTGVATGGDKITVTPASGQTLYDVGGGPDARICYAAVNPVSSTDITLTGTATSQTQPRQTGTISLSRGYIYNAFIPYYIMVDGVKWGYCNVGAFLPEEYGLYFMWGETTGHAAAKSGANAFVTGFITDNSKGFSWPNAPFNNGQSSYDYTFFGSVKNTVCPNGVLALAYDAANVNWGSSWRIPTEKEFSDLVTNTKTDLSCFTNGILTIKDNSSLIFPAAGYGDGTSFNYASTYGYYWSSSLGSSGVDYASNLLFSNYHGVIMGKNWRSHGLPVRPVSK